MRHGPTHHQLGTYPKAMMMCISVPVHLTRLTNDRDSLPLFGLRFIRISSALPRSDSRLAQAHETAGG